MTIELVQYVGEMKRSVANHLTMKSAPPLFDAIQPSNITFFRVRCTLFASMHPPFTFLGAEPCMLASVDLLFSDFSFRFSRITDGSSFISPFA